MDHHLSAPSQPISALKASPVKTRSIGSRYPQATIPDSDVDRDKRFKNVDGDLQNVYVGPFEPSAFLEKYFPQRDDMPKFDDERKKSVGRSGGTNKGTKKGKKAEKQVRDEKDMYRPMVDALKDFCPDFDIEITGNFQDTRAVVHFGGGLKPDIIFYGKSSFRGQRTDLMAMETHIEMKLDEDSDGFADEHATPEGTTPFLRDSDKARSTRGQLASYAGSQLASQFRTHAFSVWATGTSARLIRWDRGGVVVSTKFDYTKESYLADFFWCLSHADPAARGYDESVTVAGESDAPHVENAKRVLGLDQDATIYKFKVYDERTKMFRFYYGVNTITKSSISPVGRSTRGFEVVDESGNKVYLKDTWRIYADGYHKEGEIYEELKGIGRLIPTVLAHGDVTGRWQTTDSHEWCVGELRKHFRVHCHYFIVLKEIGRPLSKFRTTKELVTALRDALQAHTEAYRKGILHRDISIGNILISENGGGLLIDWEFGKSIANPEVRVMARTGTWQFMSAHLLSNTPGTVEHTLVDDLESFFHVLCYVVLVHCPHEFPNTKLKRHLKKVYDAWFFEDEDDEEGEVVGGDEKAEALAHLFMLKKAELPYDPLRDLVIALEDVIGVRYRDRPTQKARTIYEGLRAKYDMTDEELEEQPVWRYDETMRKLNESSQWMLATFNNTLEDPRGLTATPVSRDLLCTNRKRIDNTLKVMSNRGSTNQEDGSQAGGSSSKRKRKDVHGSDSKKARKGGR